MNPFGSRCIRPDCNVYRFDRDDAVDQSLRVSCWSKLLQTLKSERFAAIVGSHGTGKSTLLRSLEAELNENFERVIWLNMTTEKRPSCRDLRAILETECKSSSTCVVVDGYEQLRLWQRLAVVTGIKRRRTHSLLVTTHKKMFMIPTCFETRWEESMSRFLTDLKLQCLPVAMRSELWARFEHRLEMINLDSRNLRELWFSLYDEYEFIRKQEKQTS